MIRGLRMFKKFVLLILLLLPVAARATEVGATNDLFGMLVPYTTNLSNNLQAVGIKLFFSLTLLQLVITGYGLVAQGEIEASMGKFARAFIWTSFCVWLMTNNTASNFLSNTIQYFLNHAIGWATGSAADFSVSGIFQVAMRALDDSIRAIGTSMVPSTATGWAALFLNGGSGAIVQLVYGAVMIGLIVIVVFVTCVYVALKIFMIKIEAALILGIMPLSLSFLGLNALRDQGFAPFKSMLALIYRIVIMGVVTGGLAAVGASVKAYADNPDASPNVVQVTLALVSGFIILAFLAHKSDQIATSLANGSASLGSGDAVGTALAAAAAGAAVGAMAGNAAGGVKSMADTMKGLSGSGGGSIRDMSSKGTGKTPEPAPAKPSAALGGQTDGPPTRGASKGAGGDKSAAAESNTGGGNSASVTTNAASPAEESSAAPAGGNAAPPAESSSTAPAGSRAASPVGGGAAPSGSGAASAAGSGTAPAGGSAASPAGGGAAPGGSSTTPAASTTLAPSPKRPAPSSDAAAPPEGDAPAGSGANASISGSGMPERNVAEELANRVDPMSAPKKTTGDHLRELGDHVAGEKAHTTVSLNVTPHE